MSLVYITNASLNLIVKSLKNKRKNLTRDTIASDISNDLMAEFDISKEELQEFYNTSQLESMHSKKSVLEDFKGCVESIQENKDLVTRYVQEQNRRYAYKVKAPSYHINSSCEWMKKSFSNVEVPKECLFDKETHSKIKEWIQTKHLTFEELNKKFQHEFNCSESLIPVQLENSGDTIYDNSKIKDEIKEDIKQKRRQLRFLLDGEMSKKINNYKYAPSFKIQKMKGNEKNQPIIDFHTAKNELEKIISDIYIRKYNKELSFDETILDSIGFNRCKSCG